MHGHIISLLFLQLLSRPCQFILHNQEILQQLLLILLQNFNLIHFLMIVIVQPCMFGGQFVMNTVNFVDFVLKFEPHADLLVEWLFGFLEVLNENIFLIFQVDIFLTQEFEFLINFTISLLINLIIILYDPLPFLNLLSQRLNLPRLIPLNLTNHCLKGSLWTKFQQYGINFPNCFL